LLRCSALQTPLAECTRALSVTDRLARARCVSARRFARAIGLAQRAAGRAYCTGTRRITLATCSSEVDILEPRLPLPLLLLLLLMMMLMVTVARLPLLLLLLAMVERLLLME
jgi:hypothetical protein